MRSRSFLTATLMIGCASLGGCAATSSVCLLNYVHVSEHDTADTKRQNLVNNEVLKSNGCPDRYAGK